MSEVKEYRDYLKAELEAAKVTADVLTKAGRTRVVGCDYLLYNFELDHSEELKEN